MVLSRSSPPQASSFSSLNLWDVNSRCSSQLSAWACCSSSLARSSRPTHRQQSHLRTRLPHLRPWLPCFTFMSASIRWVGDLCHGYMLLISSLRGRGTTVLLSHLRHNGFGVNYYSLTSQQCAVLMTPLSADFVVSKVTPTIHTNLGYKMFLMFAALNIGAMATFSLCVLVSLIIIDHL